MPRAVTERGWRRAGALAVLMMATAPTFAGATCLHGEETVFACRTVQGKRIEVCDAGRTLSYAFGRPGQRPEIVLRVPRAAASTWQWQGVGRYLSYAVNLPNGNTEYSVFWGMDRLSDGHEVEAGVHVSIDGRPAATVRCAPGAAIEQNIEGIDLRAAD
ncbi:hypothetical protein [Crenobacter intestini]|uniref:DUF2845 domain-containing protein n=1 Tax=Crenobacter intestini TaxID=2563443 RepID=A0A4T0UT09_9NEIS|nr:hypothetical protein [Crenobacter intestini]TIC82044.1 hypothetical protein E5K04_09800 [Crenobacter intestini]